MASQSDVYKRQLHADRNDGRPYRDSIDGPVQRTLGYRQLTFESQIVRHSSGIKAVIHWLYSIVLARSKAASLH